LGYTLLMRTLLAACLLTLGCTNEPSSSVRAPVLSGPCPALPFAVGQVSDDRLDEISGVTESRSSPGVFFVHNDSGDSPRFFALDRSGRVLAELLLETVPRLVDAEDIALGPGPDGRQFVYLGDTGNNVASGGIGIPRRKAIVYRIPEPKIDLSARQAKLVIKEAFPIAFTFPSGARDIEAFIVDPQSGELIMISKQADGRSQLLTASAATLAAGGGELLPAGELRFGRAPLPGSPLPTSASVSRDGRAILVRSYSSVFLFRRGDGEPVVSALSRAPQRLPSPRGRGGEAISFAEFDTAYLTISEGDDPELHCASLAP
jgi:hypothetical protein